MKFIVDAELPLALAELLQNSGHEGLHTTELPQGNDTSDIEINRVSLSEQRIVISKDGISTIALHRGENPSNFSMSRPEISATQNY